MEETNLPKFTAEELRDLKTQYNKAKDLLEKITSLHLRYDSAIKSFETRYVDVDKVVADVKERYTTVENLKNDSVTFLGELKSNLEKVQTSITQVEEGYAKFQNIYGKIEGKEGEIEALTSSATGLKNDIETSKATAQQRLSEIEQQLVQVQEKVTTMQSAYESFLATQAKINDGTTGLQAILDQSAELQKKSVEVFAEIKSFSVESKKILDEIEANKNQTDVFKAEIQANLDSTKENISRITEVTDLITDTGFANSFSKREKMLRFSAGIWMGVFILAFCGLVYTIYHLFFTGDPGVPEMQIIFYRLTLTSPFLFLIGIALKQYGHERDLNERYAFKATIAAVVRSHADFLVSVEERAGLENGKFLRDTLQDIYFEPYEKGVGKEEIKKELTEILEDKNKKKNKMPEFISGMKELKEIIPDEATLKSIIEFYLKLK